MANNRIRLDKIHVSTTRFFQKYWSYYFNNKLFKRNLYTLCNNMDENDASWLECLDEMEQNYITLSKVQIPVCILHTPPVTDPYYNDDMISFVRQGNNWLEIERGPIFKKFIAYFYVSRSDICDPPVVHEIDATVWAKIGILFINWIKHQLKIKRYCQVAGLAYVSSDGYLLFSKTIYSQAYCLSFPGGTLNPGESRAACAIREFYEETGWDPSNGNQTEFTQMLEKNEREKINFFESGKGCNFWIVGSKTAEEVSQIQPTANAKEVKRLYWINLKLLPSILETRMLGSTSVSRKILDVMNKMHKSSLF